MFVWLLFWMWQKEGWKYQNGNRWYLPDGLFIIGLWITFILPLPWILAFILREDEK